MTTTSTASDRSVFVLALEQANAAVERAREAQRNASATFMAGAVNAYSDACSARDSAEASLADFDARVLVSTTAWLRSGESIRVLPSRFGGDAWEGIGVIIETNGDDVLVNLRGTEVWFHTVRLADVVVRSGVAQ